MMRRRLSGRLERALFGVVPVDSLNAGASFQLDGEEARTGTLLAEHVIGIEQDTMIE
jgi:hypothetical protein